MKSTITQLNYLLNKKNKLKVALILGLIIIGSLAELLSITIIMPIINLAMDTSDYSKTGYYSVINSIYPVKSKEELLLILISLTIVIYILKNAFLCFQCRTQYRFSAEIRKDFSTRLMSAYLKQPYSYFLNVNSADLIRSVSSDVDQLFQLISSILNIMSNGITALVIVVYLAISNVYMTLTVSIVLGLCLCIIVFGLQKSNRKNGRRNQYLQGQMGKHLRQAFEGIKEIKIMNTESHFIDTYKDTYTEVADINVKFTLFSTLPKYLIEVFSIIAILGYLGMNIVYNENYYALVPKLAVFCVAAFKLLPSVNALYQSINSAIYYKASIDLVYHDIKEADSFEYTFDNADLSEKLDFQDAIRLEDVSFRYDGTDRDVIDEANIEIKRGTSVAFIGASGGGKTTTADLILNLLKPTKGTVKVDDVDVATKPFAWNRMVGYIPQNIYLTDDTIRSNVAFGINNDAIDDKEVLRALKDAQLMDFIEKLPDGIYTKVGERGVRISGGQRQRLGIARALYRNPDVLVFDEATSALDNETEKEVMAAIDSLQGVKTILMIAHRLSTIEKCTAVYKIENGKAEKVKG